MHFVVYFILVHVTEFCLTWKKFFKIIAGFCWSI